MLTILTRRALTVGLVLSIVAAPRAAEAQQTPSKTVRVGYLSLRSGPSSIDEAFREGLRELGYVEGRNITIDYRWADLKTERLPALAAELVRLKPDVIVATSGNRAALAAKAATTTIPIVFTASDPVGVGLVASLDRPGGNLTGVSVLTTELNTKRLELLKETVPGVSRIAVLVHLTSPTREVASKDLQRAARELGVGLDVLEVRDPEGVNRAFTEITRMRTGALVVVADPIFFAQKEQIVRLAARSRVPAIFEWREFAEAGGLLSYGANIGHEYRRLAVFVDKVLKGTRPGDLPIEQPTKFELVVNLKTARALGLTMPPSLLLRADQIIE